MKESSENPLQNVIVFLGPVVRRTMGCFSLVAHFHKVKPVSSFRAEGHLLQTGLTWPLSNWEAAYLPETKPALQQVKKQDYLQHSANEAHVLL